MTFTGSNAPWIAGIFAAPFAVHGIMWLLGVSP